MFKFRLNLNFIRTYANIVKRKNEQIYKEKQFEKKKPTRVFEPIEIDRNEKITVSQLANLLNRTTNDIFECLKSIPNGYVYKNKDSEINSFNVVLKIMSLCGFKPRYNTSSKRAKEEMELLKKLDDEDDNINKRERPKNSILVSRPPIVTTMGHVDHGKTTLLDSLRNSNVAQNEFGFITQHIGAFNTKFSDKKSVTFLDTPGHAAFMSMRERGAKLTDIIVLVIACDDGIMEQTVESIRLAQQSNCQILVALNKCDKINYDVNKIRKVKESLMQYNIQTEDMGGDIQVVEISALKKQNLDLLLDKLWALAELLELKGDPKGLVEGYVIESYQDAHRGKLATVIIKRGCLRRGMFLLSGSSFCKVKQLFDDRMNVIEQASLSQAVQVMGWKDLPHVGDECIELKTEAEAKRVLGVRIRREQVKKQNEDQIEIEKKRKEHLAQYQAFLKEKGSKKNLRFAALDDPAIPNIKITKKEETDVNSLPIIIKSDVNGTLEAILNILETYQGDEVKLDLIHFEVGPVTQNDLQLCDAFNGIIYCFNLKENKQLLENEQFKNVRIKHFNIIYNLVDDLKVEIQKLAPFEEYEVEIGDAVINATFTIDDKKKEIIVGGGTCKNGLIDSKKLFKIIRLDENQKPFVVADKQKCSTLKHFKTEVATIKKGADFGLSFEDKELKILKDDKIICYEIQSKRKTIDWDCGF